MYHDFLTRVVEKMGIEEDLQLQWSDGDSHSDMNFVYNLKGFQPLASPKTSRKLNFGSLQKAYLLGMARILNCVLNI